MRFIICLCSFLLLVSSCKEKPEMLPDVKEIPKEKATQIFTKTYRVKQQEGIWVKDTVRKIESILIDSQGNEIAKNLYNLDGSIFNTEEYIYNDKGQKIRANLYKDGEVPTGYFTYTLDNQGRIIRQELFNTVNKQKIMEGVTRYLENGRIKQMGAIDNTGGFVPTHEFVYDENDKEIGFNVYKGPQGDKDEFIFLYNKFNDDGEWIERQALKDGKLESIYVRTFVEKELE